MSAPVKGERALRFNSSTTKRMWLSVVFWLVLTPLFAWFLFLGTALGSTVGIAIAAGAVAIVVLGPQLYTYLRIRGLRLAGDQLVRGGKSCDLTASWDINLEVVERRSVQRLVLHADDLRVMLGSSSLPLFFEPADLRRLAAPLARSAHPGPREVAEQLTKLADDPSRESWPLPRSD